MVPLSAALDFLLSAPSLALHVPKQPGAPPGLPAHAQIAAQMMGQAASARTLAQAALGAGMELGELSLGSHQGGEVCILRPRFAVCVAVC